MRGLFMRYRWLYNNQLSGTIPPTLGSLNGLKTLCVPRQSVGLSC